jgi:hypothetical protein
VRRLLGPALLLASLTLFAAAARAVVGANGAAVAVADAVEESGSSLPGTGSPYPSTIAIGGQVSPVGDVNVTLTGVSHPCPIDLDVLLVSPGGIASLVLSDVGGCVVDGAAPRPVNVTLDDDVAGQLSEMGTLATGSFRPANLDGSGGPCTDDPDSFPGASPAPNASGLAAFEQGPANGTWSLYVVDDCFGDSGSIGGGWSIAITPAAPTAVRLLGFTARRTPARVELRWRTASEASVAGFDVFRARGRDLTKLNRRLILARGVRGAAYRFVDPAPPRAAAVTYRLRATLRNGRREWVGAAAVSRLNGR